MTTSMMFWGVLAAVLIVIVTSAIFAVRRRQSALACIAILGALAAPVLIWTVAQPALDMGQVAIGYLILVPILIWWRTRLRGWPDAGDGLGVSGYVLALIASFVAAVISGPQTLLGISLAAAAVMNWLSYFEKRPDLSYVAITATYLGLTQVVTTQHWPEGAYAAILVASGVVFYLIGYLLENADPKRSQAFRLGGVIGPFLGTLLSLTGSPSQIPILCLAGAGGLFWVEAYLQRSRVRQELAGGVLLATYCWLLAYNHISEVQIYSLPWAAYFAYLASRRGPTQELARSILISAALAALTFPIALQSLSDTGQLYGMELIFLGLVLMVIGASQLQRLVLWWGAGTSAIEALYLLPKYFAPDSQYPLIFALGGLAVFAVVVMFTQGRRDS